MKHLLLAFVLTGCATTEQPAATLAPATPALPQVTDVATDDKDKFQIERWVDPTNGVVCYILDKGFDDRALSCVVVP